MVMSFPRGSIMTWADRPVTDHNRSELSVDIDRIETTTRMANGTMRKYIVADKRSFSLSWEDLPDGRAILNADNEVIGYTNQTVDGGMGGAEMEAMYVAGQPFVMRLHPFDPEYPGPVEENPRFEEYTVFITKFDKEITRRGKTMDLWDVKVQLEEV